MVSRTTLWRRKKCKRVLSRRGRHTAEDRQDRLDFVGAVVAQLLQRGHATYHGLKLVAHRDDFHLAILESGEADNHEQPRVHWQKPSGEVWQKILDSPHNADCLALAAAYIGSVTLLQRPESLRGKYHRDTRAKRESSRMICWQSIPDMTKQTAHYWRARRKSDYANAVRWLGSLLKKHGLKKFPSRGESTLIRDDLADIRAGKRLA